MALTREMSKTKHFDFDKLCHVDDQVDTHNNNKQLSSIKDNAVYLVPSLPYAEGRHKSRKSRLHLTNNARSNYTPSSSSKVVLSSAHQQRLKTL